MFLAGLKFALGFATGSGALVAFVLCVIAIAEWTSFQRKKRREQTDKRIVGQTKVAIARRERVFVVLRYPSWVNEPEESANPKFR
jgi:hypothetical protein